MGRGFASQCNKFPGLDVACLVDLDIDRIRKVFKEITELEPVISGDLKTLLNALENNQPIGFTDISLISKLPLDVVVEATGVPEIGAQVTESSLKSKKHVAVLNVECDGTPVSRSLAIRNRSPC